MLVHTAVNKGGTASETPFAGKCLQGAFLCEESAVQGPDILTVGEFSRISRPPCRTDRSRYEQRIGKNL